MWYLSRVQLSDLSPLFTSVVQKASQALFSTHMSQCHAILSIKLSRLRQGVSGRANVPPGHSAVSGDSFGCRGAAVLWVVAWDELKLVTHTTKHCPAKDVHS